MAKLNRTAGFSLIELMVTVMIVGFLASVALPLYIQYGYKSRSVEAKTYLGSLRAAELTYKSSHAAYLNVDGTGTPPQPLTGQRKKWDKETPSTTADIADNSGKFIDMGFEAIGTVYFHYACKVTQPSDAVRCEAAADLDEDSDPAAWVLAWRVNPSDVIADSVFVEPANTPVPNFGEIHPYTPFKF